MYEGLNVLSGGPKHGKSLWALNVGLAVATGGKALGNLDVQLGEVLYLALEDGKRRVQDRTDALLSEEEAWPSTFYVTHHAPKDGDGLIEALSAWLKEHPAAQLIIIDTLARVRDPKKRGADAYQEDYALGSRLQELALLHHVAILIVHHTKKGREDDFLAQVSGSFEVTGPGRRGARLRAGARCRGRRLTRHRTGYRGARLIRSPVDNYPLMSRWSRQYDQRTAYQYRKPGSPPKTPARGTRRAATPAVASPVLAR